MGQEIVFSNLTRKPYFSGFRRDGRNDYLSDPYKYKLREECTQAYKRTGGCGVRKLGGCVSMFVLQPINPHFLPAGSVHQAIAEIPGFCPEKNRRLRSDRYVCKNYPHDWLASQYVYWDDWI